jgi:hypothetical protein
MKETSDGKNGKFRNVFRRERKRERVSVCMREAADVGRTVTGEPFGGPKSRELGVRHGGTTKKRVSAAFQD